MKRVYLVWSIAIPLILVLVSTAPTADYPTKFINIFIPAPPGGSHDAMARTFASAAEKYLGQPIIAVNKPGAGGLTGTIATIQAPADGYTLFVDSTMTESFVEWERANGKKPPYELDAFIVLGSFTMSPAVVVTPFESPWSTLIEMIKDCKAKPNHYAFCSSGLYGGTHLPAELFMLAAGITARHVVFQGGGPCFNALVGKHVDFSTQWPSASIPLIRGKKLRALAILSDKRLKSMPDVPTAKELGIDAEWFQWLGISAPKNTPLPIIAKLREVVKQVAEDESFLKIVENTGDEVRYKNSEELAKFRIMEAEKLARLYKQLIGVKK